MEKLKEKKPVGAVMVVGGGIGGMQASLDLAESGFYVYLVDNSPTIGGVMAQLDKTFPTNDCSMCIMSPKLVECGRHFNIRVISNAEVEGIEGDPGRFAVTVAKKPRYIRTDRCTGCGECAKHCPVTAIDAYNEKMSRRAAIYIKYPQAIPKVFLIDRNQCIGCGLCERVCLAKAVNYGDQEIVEKIEVGSIILSPGFEVFDARLRQEFGYGVYPNVVSSIEFERLLSATGPHRGHLLRPSDGTIPERIAFIQCVGSRDSNCGNDYCSSVCCMYATKEAIIAKEHVHFVKPTIFYMDVRAYGKGFDAYYERAKSEYGVRFIKCMVSKVRERFKTKNLLLTYLNEGGKIEEEEFDLVVLSVGMVPSKGTVEMAKRMGLEVDGYGFCKTGPFEPTSTSKPGIYVCGAFQGPKDIPETVTQASGAVADATGLIASARGTMAARREYPAEADVAGEEPRIGVFVCHCGINIGGVAGMTAALKLAEQEYEVFLLEKEAQLGGNLRNLRYTLEGEDVQAFLKDLINKVTNHPSIHVITNGLVVDFSGSKGNFSTGVMVAPTMYYRKIEHGVTILATGAEEWKPTEYLYGQDPRIVTQLELEGRINQQPDEVARANQVVMIQCVGSRNEERPYCSRTCCATAVKNGLKIKELNPRAKITILYRDMRTYGLLESYYAKARNEGILFMKYEAEEKPEVQKDGESLSVSFLDRILKEQMRINPDLLVLSAATLPRENEELATMLKVPRTAEGFFLEAHMKLRPVDFATDGLYLAGAGHGPKLISESISQASAAVARACTILSKEKMLIGGVVAVVEGERCAACLTCVRVCPYSVPMINARGEAEIDLAKCKGCGSCAAECPAKAIELMHFRDRQLQAKCQALVNAECGMRNAEL